MHLQKGEIYFLHTDPEAVGSPPRRVPPPILADRTDNYGSHCSNLSNHWTYPEVSVSGDENGVQQDITSLPSDSVNSSDTLQLGLPDLRTGICLCVPCFIMKIKKFYEIFYSIYFSLIHFFF